MKTIQFSAIVLVGVLLNFFVLKERVCAEDEERYIQNEYQKITVTKLDPGAPPYFKIEKIESRIPDPDFVFGSDESPIWNVILYYEKNNEFKANIIEPADIMNNTGIENWSWGPEPVPQDSIWFRWEDIDLDAIDSDLSGTLSILCSIAFRAGDRKAHWHIETVLEDGIKEGIYKVRYPYYRFDELNNGGNDDYLTIPKFQGCILKDPIDMAVHRWPIYGELDGVGQNYYDIYKEKRDESPRFTWPSYMEMQFFTYYDSGTWNGLYIASHDPDKYMKSLFYKQMPENPPCQHLDIYFTFYPEDIYVATDKAYLDSVEVPYSIVTDVFEGDWLDGSKIYREWALAQSWCDSGRFETRTDIGEIPKGLDYFMLFSQPDSSYDSDQDTIIDAAIDSMNTNGYTLSKPLIVATMRGDRRYLDWKPGFRDSFITPLFEEHGESLCYAPNFTSNE
jgi:hypothetical protein